MDWDIGDEDGETGLTGKTPSDCLGVGDRQENFKMTRGCLPSAIENVGGRDSVLVHVRYLSSYPPR